MAEFVIANRFQKT